MSLDSNEIISFNIQAHDEIASNYDERHTEIFNPTEQQRIQRVVEDAYRCLTTRSENKVILDFGSGTGNLTQYLLRLDASVIATDVSTGCLEVVQKKFCNHNNLTTLVLNGNDLKEIKNNSIDMIATYSVLHHVPDYLKIIGEFTRVVKPGGVIYIDHEVDETYWEYNAAYMSYLKELGNSFYTVHANELGLKQKIGVKAYLKALLNKLRPERNKPKSLILCGAGDIHVYRHDHINWGEIENILCEHCTIEAGSTYLVCRETEDPPSVWENWHTKCIDMRFIIARKKSSNAH